MQPIATDVAWSVCVCMSVCLLDTTMSPASMDEPIKMPFGLWTRVGPRNNLLTMHQIDN